MIEATLARFKAACYVLESCFYYKQHRQMDEPRAKVACDVRTLQVLDGVKYFRKYKLILRNDDSSN